MAGLDFSQYINTKKPDQNLNPNNNPTNDPGYTTSTGPGGEQIITFPGVGGQAPTHVVLPATVDFSSLQAPFVDFGKALDQALNYGKQAKDTFYTDINSQQNKDTALGLVNTDIQGIKTGIDALAPLATSYGNKDTQININRANAIDAANFARTPGFNQFNEGQISGINDFNRGERQKSIDASGLDYSGRISKILNQLGTQSEGRLSDPLLNTLMTTTSRNRGADIGAASGITGRSGAGTNIQDKLDINQRIQLALDAQKTLPSVLTQAQSVLQPPELQYSGVLATPTGIPLNASNIGDRIPITSNISAGQAQLQIGQAAASLETIPASQVLSQGLQTAQYNATGAFNTDLTKLTEGQAQLQATDSAIQSGFNQVKADDIRAQGYAQFQSGLQQAQNSANTQAAGSIINGIGGALINSPVGQGILGSVGGFVTSAVNSLFGGGGGSVGSSGGGGGGGSQAIGQNTDGSYIYGPGGGQQFASANVGSTTVDSGSMGNFMSGIKNFWSGAPETSSNVNIPSQIDGQNVTDGQTLDTGEQQYNLENGDIVTQPASPSVFKQIASGGNDIGVDAKTVAKTADAVMNWDKLTPAQQMSATGNIATEVLQNKGMITAPQATNINNAQNALLTMANPDSTPSQRATALLTAGAGAVTTQFTGSVGAPLTIQGSPVLQSTLTSDGQPGFQLANGDVVPQSDLTSASNVLSGVQAFAVLTNPSATTEQKVLALTSVGVNAATANSIVSQVAGGNINAALSVINTAANWNQMTPVQQATSLLQTGHSVMSGLSEAGVGGEVLKNTGASFLSTAPTAGAASLGSAVLGAAGVAAGSYVGQQQAEGLMNLAKGKPVSPVQHAALFFITGGLDNLVKPIGDLFGSGKSKEQKLRDGWRNNLTAYGLATKENGTQFVSLADGSKYNIGIDGTNKLKNTDGTERFSFDVDWNNQAAVQSIPEAHLFALASGLDPTTNSSHDLFNKAVSQSLNAASSNSNSIEGIRSNFKSMMQNTNPTQLAMRVEVLRASNKINDQEYGVYLDQINKTWGTQIDETDKAKASNSLIETLKTLPNPSKQDKQLLETLTNEKQLAKNQAELDKRITPNA